MRVIVINPWNQTVAYAEHSGNYRDYYQLLSGPTTEDGPDARVDCFDIVRVGRRIAMFVDDCGMLQSHQAFFQLGANPTPFAGRGVIAGEGSDGDTAAVPLTVEQVRATVTWVPLGSKVTSPPPLVQSYNSHEEMLAAMVNPPSLGPHIIELPE